MKFLFWLVVVAVIDHYTGVLSSIGGMPIPPTQMIQRTITQPPCQQEVWDTPQEI